MHRVCFGLVMMMCPLKSERLSESFDDTTTAIGSKSFVSLGRVACQTDNENTPAHDSGRYTGSKHALFLTL